MITLKGTVVAIDYNRRELTIRGPKGNEVTVVVPQAVERFASLKASDVITARYMEGTVCHQGAWRTIREDRRTGARDETR